MRSRIVFRVLHDQLSGQPGPDAASAYREVCPIRKAHMDAGTTGALESRRDEGPTGPCPPSPPPPAPSPTELDATLQHLERLCGRLEQAEARFKQLTDECEGVLTGLVAVDRRHSSVIAGLNDRLGDWYHLESKLLEESARRIEQFERGVGHEWLVLRQLHEEPLAQLKDDADQLRMACLEAARTARFRFDAVEKACTSYAAEMERRLEEWNRELLGAVRSAGGGDQARPALPAPPAALALPAATDVQPWPLEGVAQLHHELRAGGTGLAPSAAAADPPAHDGTVGHSTTAGSPGNAAAPGTMPALTRRARWKLTWPGVAALTAAATIVVALGGYALLRGGNAEGAASRAQPPALHDAPAAPAAAASGAPSGVLPAGSERIAEAERAAERAGAMVEILAAADLRRYALAGVPASAPNPPYGQVLWSRSRGLAASASRLPALPEGKVYRLWIVPDGPPVAAGVLAPDAAGRAGLVLGGPLKLPLPVTIQVTVEDRGAAGAPSGPVCLTRVPIQ
jgi:hypothetical protein